MTDAAKKGVQEMASKMKSRPVMNALTNFAVKKISFDKRAAWNARMTSPQVQVAIQVQCRNLPQRNTKHASAFCVIWQVPSGYTGCEVNAKSNKPCAWPRPQEHEVGRTEVVRDSQNPIYREHVVVDYKFELE